MGDQQAHLLIVDDELSVRDSLTSWFRKDGHRVSNAADGQEALQLLQEGPVDLVLLDIKMPGIDGMELQRRIHALDTGITIIMMTAFASVETAVQALKQGAFDYVTKPIDPDELSHLVQRAIEQRRLKEENVQLRKTIDHLTGADTIVGDSAAMASVLESVRHVAQTDATVLIQGESGTGKELIARAVHANSHRRYFPIVPVNCGALPESLLESELFGHEKGAFTGAQFRRKGKIEMASGGTLFLDEIGTISAKMQVDLLRVLETKEFTRLGGNKPVHADFRVICATNEDLEQAVAAGTFREDLFYRINVFSIQMPPLRIRPEDIPPLARHFLQKFASQMDKRIAEISPDAMQQLTSYTWPGNVRELANAIERAIVVGTPPAIRPSDLPFRLQQPAPATGDALWEVERSHIAGVLARTEWNMTRAAEVLEIDRGTLYNKVKKFDLQK